MEKDPQQEDFLQGRMQGNPYRSVLSYVIHKVLCIFVVVVAYQKPRSIVDKLSGASSERLLPCFNQFLREITDGKTRSSLRDTPTCHGFIFLFFSHPLTPYLSFHQETTAIQSLLTDTSQKRTSRFDPCLSLILLFD